LYACAIENGQEQPRMTGVVSCRSYNVCNFHSNLLIFPEAVLVMFLNVIHNGELFVKNMLHFAMLDLETAD